MGRQRVSNNHWVSGALIVVLAAPYFFCSILRMDDPWMAKSDTKRVGRGRSAVGTSSQAEDQSLSAENDSLKAQLATLQVIASQLPTSSTANIRAMVYSRYPMNFRNELLVSAGSDDGVATGAAVVFQGMLIGQVQQVFLHESLVQTIFDNNVKMPVRIGVGGVNGLLQGGSYPMVGSIASAAPVAPDDIVYSAAPGIAYALPIAQVAATSTSADSLFQQATLSFPYDVNNIETVLIMK